MLKRLFSNNPEVVYQYIVLGAFVVFFLIGPLFK